MRVVFISIFFALTSPDCFAQLTAEWMASKKVSLSNYGYCVSPGPEGNVYVSGSFSGSYRDPGPQEQGGFLTCYNSNGEEKWHKEFYNISSSYRIFNAVDSKGNIIVAGPGLMRFSSQGHLLDSIPIKGFRMPEGLCIDGQDNIILAGLYFEDSLMGEMVVEENSFLAKYQPEGAKLWERSCYINQGPNQDFDLTVDAQGHIYTSGGFGGSMNLSPDLILTSNYRYDGFVIKYDPHGNVVWAQKFGGEKSEYPRAITVDKKGDIYIAGTYYGIMVAESFSTPVHQGVCDLFLIKYNSDGKLQWLKSGGGEDLEKIREITIDKNDNLFLTGYYLSPGIFQWGNYSFSQTEKDRGYFYVMQLDKEGDVVTMTHSDMGTGEGRDLICDNQGHLYVTGGFGGILDFAGKTLEGEGMFLMKLSYDMTNKVGLHEESSPQDLFHIFPNPGKDFFYISLSDDLCPDAAFQVYETTGRCILSKPRIGCDERNFQCTAPPGVYLVELRSGSQRQTRKVIIQ